MQQRMLIKLRSYDHRLVDRATQKVTKTLRNTGTLVLGPIPLPTKRSRYTVLRSPHVYKKSREQFQLLTHRRLIGITAHNPAPIEALKQTELPSGVDVTIKMV